MRFVTLCCLCGCRRCWCYCCSHSLSLSLSLSLKHRLPDRHSCLNLYPWVIKVQSVGHSLSLCDVLALVFRLFLLLGGGWWVGEFWVDAFIETVIMNRIFLDKVHYCAAMIYIIGYSYRIDFHYCRPFLGRVDQFGWSKGFDQISVSFTRLMTSTV